MRGLTANLRRSSTGLMLYSSDLNLTTDTNGALIASMLSLPTSGRYQVMPATLEDQKNNVLKAMVSIAVALSAQAPLLIVVEDLHWADHSTMEFLDLLVEEVRTRPILLVSAFRPELASPWTRYPNVTSIRLRHLSRNESIDLIDGVTGGRQLPVGSAGPYSEQDRWNPVIYRGTDEAGP